MIAYIYTTKVCDTATNGFQRDTPKSRWHEDEETSRSKTKSNFDLIQIIICDILSSMYLIIIFSVILKKIGEFL